MLRERRMPGLALHHPLAGGQPAAGVEAIAHAVQALFDGADRGEDIRRVDRESCETPLSDDQIEQLNAALSEFGKKTG